MVSPGLLLFLLPFLFNIENQVLPPGCRPYSPTRRARVYEPEAGPEAGPGSLLLRNPYAQLLPDFVCHPDGQVPVLNG